MRCAWCKRTRHIVCAGQQDDEICDLGHLAGVIVPPSAVLVGQNEVVRDGCAPEKLSCDCCWSFLLTPLLVLLVIMGIMVVLPFFFFFFSSYYYCCCCYYYYYYVHFFCLFSSHQISGSSCSAHIDREYIVAMPFIIYYIHYHVCLLSIIELLNLHLMTFSFFFWTSNFIVYCLFRARAAESQQGHPV